MEDIHHQEVGNIITKRTKHEFMYFDDLRHMTDKVLLIADKVLLIADNALWGFHNRHHIRADLGEPMYNTVRDRVKYNNSEVTKIEV